MKPLAFVLLVLVASNAAAQRGGQGRPRVCIVEWNDLPPESHSTIQKTSTGNNMWFFGGGFRANCRGTNMRVFSDSAEYSEDLAVMTLIGHARYTEDGTTMNADLMRYRQNDAQVFAEGNVRVTTQTGTTLTSDLLQYLRPIPATRNYTAADASGHVRLVMRDSVAAPDSTTTTIESQRLHMLRDSLFFAAVNVVITRSDIVATADSAETNSKRQNLRLVGTRPQIRGQGTRAFTIDGELLDVFGREQKIERLIARGKAVAVSDSLELRADTLDIRTTGTTIDRIDARSAGNRSRAISPGRDISAVRLEISMPGQKLNDLRAYGKARAETEPTDSLIVTTEKDWIEGDTLTAVFDQSAAVDSSSQPPMRSLIAVGAARSFYQAASRDKSCKDPTISYVTGTKIQVHFENGEMNEVEVKGNVRGLNASPCKASTDTVPPRRGTSR